MVKINGVEVESPAQLNMSAATKIYLNKQPRVKAYQNLIGSTVNNNINTFPRVTRPPHHLYARDKQSVADRISTIYQVVSSPVTLESNSNYQANRVKNLPSNQQFKVNDRKTGRVSEVNAEEIAIKHAISAKASHPRPKSKKESCNSPNNYNRSDLKTPSYRNNSPPTSNSTVDQQSVPAATNTTHTKPVPQKSSEGPRKTLSSSSNKDTNVTPTAGTEVQVANSKPKVTLPHYLEPMFYIGGGNGVAIIEDVMLGLGWKRTKEKDDNYKIKWCELKSQINYHTFKECEQVVNHIPNCNLLTNKLGLLNSLQEYDRMSIAYRRKVPKLDFIPETFKLDDPREREAFRQTFKEGDMFICKPTGRNQGKGIFLVKTPQEVNKVFEEQETRTKDGKPVKPLNRIIQRYLHKPLLLNKKKFDLRCYMLVASTVPYFVVFHKGYVRLSIHDYDVDSDNLIAHLTNQFIQKKDPTYKDVKDETTWSMEKFNEYVNDNCAEEKGLEKDWVFGAMTNRMKQIMTYCFNAVKHKLACKIGYFDLYGFDFMVDDEMKVWLIEVNVNPCLATNCEALREVIPGCVKETIHLALECFDKSRKGKPLLPLQSLQNFEILVNACPKSGSGLKGSSMRSKSTSPAVARRSYTRSPLKEPTIVSASTEVSRIEPFPKFVARGGGNFNINNNRRISTPTATPTDSVENSPSNNNISGASRVSNVRTTKSSGSSQSSAIKDTQELTSGDSKPNMSKSINSNSALKVTTFNLPEDTSLAKSSSSQQNKSVGKQVSQSETRSSKNFPRQNQTTDSSQLQQPPLSQSVQLQKTKVSIAKKTLFRTLKREPSISVKVITKEQQLLPAETTIVIVDNKTNTQISETQQSVVINNNNKNSSGGARRSVYINSSAGSKKLHSPAATKTAVDSPDDDEIEEQKKSTIFSSKTSHRSGTGMRATSKTPISSDQNNRRSTGALNGGRKSSVPGRKSDNSSPTVDYSNNEENTNRNNNRLSTHTLHGSSSGGKGDSSITGMMLPLTGITPTDPMEDSSSNVSRYATVFPISPYTEPVAQLKMTHRPIKKSKSRLSYENRGS